MIHTLPSDPLSPRRLFTSLAAPVLLASTLLACAQSGPPSAPALSPLPREIQSGQLLPVHLTSIAVPAADPDDLFAAQNITQALTQSGLQIVPPGGPADLTITLLRADYPQARQLLSSRHLVFDAPMHDEGYILLSQKTPTGDAVSIIGETSAGVFYGAQTLKQLIQPTAAGPQIWTATIRDWPAMKYRGQHDDLSRGPFPTLAFQKHQLDVFAAHKVNLYSPYFESNLEYSADPLAAPPGGALTRDEAKQLVAYATPLHIMIVPEQEAFGHVHHFLEYEKYAGVAETPHGYVIAPGQPASLPLIKSWFTQIAADFPSPFLHLGADETFDLGLGRTRPDVEKRGLGPVYADFLSSIHTTLAPLNRRLLFWGDIGDSDPSAIPGIPKDMIAIPWIYWHEDSYDHDILPFKKQGLETWVAPGDANWSQVYPLEKGALDNISGFVAAGQRLGSTGVLQTVWNDDGEGLYDQDWFGTLFGAAAGWQSGTSDSTSYAASFGPIFYGDTSGRINQAQSEIIAAEDLIDVGDDLFWLDPWSSAGIAKADKMRPNLATARLHAEQAIDLIETALATDPSLREKNALRAMELGARRIDFIALKFQLSDEMRAAYAEAYDQQHDRKKDSLTSNLLYSISSNNGRCEDLRDGFSLLKDLYRDSWLAENRPYWLGNVLVRYDLQIQLWQKRGEDIDTLINNFNATHTLPPASQVGIPAPAGTK
jgi:hypothetical protein